MHGAVRTSRTAIAAIVLGAVLAWQPQAMAQSGDGQMCGGAAGPSCSPGFFCEAPAAGCSVDNPPGTCVVRTDACTRIYKPVCGCDGKTYGNDCERIAAAARKDHDGACKLEQ